MNRDEALKAAEEFKKSRDSEKIIDLLTPHYNQKKTLDVACLLIYAYRRDKNYANFVQIKKGFNCLKPFVCMCGPTRT